MQIKEKFVSFQQRDLRWMNEYFGNTPLASSYWARQCVRAAIERNADRAHGVLLDVGCGVKPYERTFSPYISKYLGTEYSSESGFWGNRADFGSDAAALPLADESIDTILCTEVLEHVRNPELVLSEFARVLRVGGVVITTAPFFYPIHDSWDYFRYTDKGIAEILTRNGLQVELVEPLCGTGRTLAMMLNIYWFDIGFMWTKWLYPIGVVLRPVLLLLVVTLNWLGWVADKLLPSHHMAFDHITVAVKTKTIAE